MSLPVGESCMVSCHGGWEFLTVYHDMPNKSCLVIISSSKLNPLLEIDTVSISYVLLQDLACISTWWDWERVRGDQMIDTIMGTWITGYLGITSAKFFAGVCHIRTIPRKTQTHNFLKMPWPPTIHDSAWKKFECRHNGCNKRFWSKGGHTRHINARHAQGGASGQKMDSPQSQVSYISVSSCPGFLSPTSPDHILDSPLHNLDLDTFIFGTSLENDFNFNNNGNINDTPSPPPSPSQDMVLTSTEYHSYLSGKMNNL